MNDIAKKIFEEAEKLIRNGQYREAIPKLITLKRITKNREKDEILYNLGLSYLMVNRFTKAVQIFQELSKRHPDSALYHYMLGLANLKMADIPQALVNFKKASLLSPEEKEFTRRYAWTLCLMGKKKGEKMLESLFRENVKDPEITVDYILCLLKEKKLDKAKWVVELHLAHNPVSPEVLELRNLLDHPEKIKDMFLTPNELKTISILIERSALDVKTVEEITAIFLGLKGKLYRRIKNPEVWAASLEFMARFLAGENMDSQEKLIVKKYNVSSKTLKNKVSQIMEVLLNG